MDGGWISSSEEEVCLQKNKTHEAAEQSLSQLPAARLVLTPFSLPRHKI